MCLQPTVIEARTDHILALLGAARVLANANAEFAQQQNVYAGVATLITEAEADLNRFTAELKKACPAS